MEHSMLDIMWVIMAASLVFVMQAGFAMVESGLTRSKNSINVAIKNLTDLGVSLIVYWLVGFGLMFGLSFSGIFGTSEFFFDSGDAWPMVFCLFQAVFCSTAATIVSGAVAERMRYISYIFATILMALVIYPVFGHWAWGGALQGSASGWLAKLGFVDFAGSTVVHSVGAWVALAILVIIGPRAGRYKSDGTVAPLSGSNIPMAVLGVILLWFGWFGFNGGSTLAASENVAGIILRTCLAGAAGMLSALLIGWPLLKKPDVNLVINGALAGLVAITAGCHAVSAPQSILIGLVAGVLMFASSILLDKLRIDDAVGAIPVHLVAGIWGTLAVAIFGNPDILGTGLSPLEQLGIQGLGITVCGMWSFGVAWLVVKLINAITPIRVSQIDEANGLNKAEHGVSTEIYDLFSVLDQQAKTGDLSLRAPEEPFTEAGQIAGMYNNVMSKLEADTIAKDEYLQILHNVSDGLFLLDQDGVIGPYYAASLNKIFETDQLAGQKLSAVLARFVAEETRAVAEDFLQSCFDSRIAWRHLEKMNPLLDAMAYFDNGQGDFLEKNLQFLFRRLEDGSVVKRLLILVRDTSAEKNLSEEIEKTRELGKQEMEMLYRVMHVEPKTLQEFLDGLHRDLEAINGQFRAGEGNVHERLSQVFRLTHAIKGDAELLQLDFIGGKAEELENRVRELLKVSEPGGEEFLALTLLYSELASASTKLRELLQKWTGFQAQTQSIGFDGYLRQSLASMASRLASRYNKEVSLDASGLSLQFLSPQLRKPIKDILVQFVRNAVFHGFETPDVRGNQGKASAGLIQISGLRQDKMLVVRFRDDGKGLDTGALRQEAVKRGLMDSAKASAMSERDALGLIFQSGFTTVAVADSVAGKGIGMSLVRSLVKETGSSLSMRTKKGAYTEFVLSIPLSGAKQ